MQTNPIEVHAILALLTTAEYLLDNGHAAQALGAVKDAIAVAENLAFPKEEVR